MPPTPAPAPARGTLALTFPLHESFLLEILTCATTRPEGVLRWSEPVPAMRPPAMHLRPLREPDEPIPPPYRVDLYTLQRGLLKCFDVHQTGVSLAERQVLLRALYEQHITPGVLTLTPGLCDKIIQLALFDRVVY